MVIGKITLTTDRIYQGSPERFGSVDRLTLNPQERRRARQTDHRLERADPSIRALIGRADQQGWVGAGNLGHKRP
ncbi:hypothetical protein RD1_A0082 (plasmid) [Roseobacter denitrificans OCh 114]|uniref:Uncharacterized protein n=1 Tax=Roseobacter denitrificans (strain ATCC 33942 / OCh 114) TaxID=375451 RepID=Q07GL8_ROSDO|nr:hypothetical protein RD1_A0082 [Roseobacter denitrificans OCh 114]